jgi:hypothetical protein
MVNKLLIFVIIVIAIVFVAMVYSSIGRNKQDEAIKQAAREYLLNRSSEQASTEDAKRFLLQESDLTGFTMKALYNLSGANLPILADGGAGANFESATGRIQHTVSVFDSEENASLSMRIYSGSSAGVGEESKIFNFTYYGGTFKEAKLYMRENNYVHELIVDDSERDVRADAVNYGRIIDAKDGVISYVEQPNVTKTEISDIKEAEKLALKAADLNGFTQSSYGVYPSNSYNDGRITSLLESTSNDIVYHEITLN